jgi:hypothetical protein
VRHLPLSTPWITLGLAVLMMFGCALPPTRPVPPDPPDSPDLKWTLQDSGAHFIQGQGVFYGIGRAEGLRNTTLLRATADNQARAEMARLLNQYVISLAEAAGFDSQEEADRQILHGLTRSALQRARIVAHDAPPNGDSFSALCRLDLAVFKEILQGERQLDAHLRNAMIEQAEPVHTLLTGDKPARN